MLADGWLRVVLAICLTLLFISGPVSSLLLTLHSARPAEDLHPSSLQPRFIYNKQNLRPLMFSTSTALIPTPLACNYLFLFYNTLLERATLSWQHLPTLPYVIFQYGGLELAFFSGAEDVEWDFVMDFALTMLRATNRGYASTFQTTWANSERTKSVSIMLRLLQ